MSTTDSLVYRGVGGRDGAEGGEEGVRGEGVGVGGWVGGGRGERASDSGRV